MKGPVMRVLLAVDHSSASDAAIEFVRSLPARESVDLNIVTVISPVPFIDASAAGVPAEIGDILEEERLHFESRLADSMARFDDDGFRSISGEVRIGAPSQELKHLADSDHVDLVVMGAVGHSALERVLLGSVSDFVTTHAESSVLVVRPQTPGVAGAPKRVLFALDCSDRDSELVLWPSKLQLPPSTEIHLVHVMQLLSFYSQDVLQRATELWKQARASAESNGRLMASELEKSGFESTSDVLAAPHVGDALLKYADDHECDLIVTGDHGRGKLKRLFLGSVSRDVLRHASCSVLVAR
jgi:nucleotide-binding universal stress UspA family protein